ncbi:MAG: hypothetical protein ACYS8Y_04415 [Planctomycetota bacterium]|jgi:hypothetical protein
MPIVDGRYEAKISTTFQSTEEAFQEIKNKIEKSRRVRISNVPMGLLEKLMPLFKGKDVKIILPTKEKPTSELKEIGEVAVQKAKIYKDYKGIKANLGSIYFADRIFSVAWDKGKILEIDAMDYDKCVKCMKNMFDVGWRYAEK